MIFTQKCVFFQYLSLAEKPNIYQIYGYPGTSR